MVSIIDKKKEKIVQKKSFLKYLGVYVDDIVVDDHGKTIINVYQLYKCQNSTAHKKDFYFSRLNNENDKTYVAGKDPLRDRVKCSKCEEYARTKIKPYIDIANREEIKEKLQERIKCPKCHEHVDAMKKLGIKRDTTGDDDGNEKKKCNNEHDYTSIKQKGKTNRFYCNLHCKIKIGRNFYQKHKYEFRYREQKKSLTLQAFLKKISQKLYDRFHKIHNEEEVYDIKKDENKLFRLCLEIGFSQPLLARLFNTNQTKVSRLTRKIIAEDESNTSDDIGVLTLVEPITLSIPKMDSRFFYTLVYISEKDLDDLVDDFQSLNKKVLDILFPPKLSIK